MLCAKPIKKGVVEFGCGKCPPCRMNRRRLWICRIMLEAELHGAENSFVTLTYGKETCPKDGCVSKRDVQLFLKRLRRAVGALRYFIHAEYAPQNMRPHYHAALFGFRPRDHVNTPKWSSKNLCGRCQLCLAWGQGIVHVGNVESASAGYVASYVLTAKTHLSKVEERGLTPEFSLMSLRPGIGAGAARVVGEAILDEKTGEMRLVDGDVPGIVRIAGGQMPLGRYLRRKVREAMYGAKTPEEELREKIRKRVNREFSPDEKMQVVRALEEPVEAKESRRARDLAVARMKNLIVEGSKS